MADRYEDRRYISDDEVIEPARPASGAKDGDPLAELAKLIGQTDPFANFGRANPTHPLRRDAPARSALDSEQSDRHDTDAYFDREIFDEAPSPPAWVQHHNEALTGAEPADDDISSRPHPLHRFTAQQGPQAAESDAQYADGPYPDAHYGDDAPPFQNPAYPGDPYGYADEYADPSAAARDKSRRGLLTVAAVLGLAVLGTGGAFAYRTYVSSPRSGEVPVIKADNSPIKVVPPTSGDAASKLIQDRVGSAGGETLVPREEQPVDVRDPTKAGARPSSGSLATRAPSAGTVTSPSVALPVPGEEPRKVRTFTVKGDQNDASATPAAKPARTPTPSAPPAVRAPAPVTPGSTASLATPSAPLSLSPRAAATPTAPISGGYVVQVSSQRSEADAQSSYRALQAKFPTVLGSRSSTIKRADLGEKGTYYRAVLGPFTSPEEAAQLCGNLKSAGGQCVVQRN